MNKRLLLIARIELMLEGASSAALSVSVGPVSGWICVVSRVYRRYISSLRSNQVTLAGRSVAEEAQIDGSLFEALTRFSSALAAAE